MSIAGHTGVWICLWLIFSLGVRQLKIHNVFLIQLGVCDIINIGRGADPALFIDYKEGSLARAFRLL